MSTRPSPGLVSKPARKPVKRHISDSEDEITDHDLPTSSPPPSKKRRKSTMMEFDSREESPLTSPPSINMPSTRISKGKKQQVESDYEDTEEDFIPQTEHKPSAVAKRQPKSKLLDPKKRARTKTKSAKNELITARNEGVIVPSPSSNKKLTEGEQSMETDITMFPKHASNLIMTQPDPPKKKYPTIKKKSKLEEPTTSNRASPASQTASKPNVKSALNSISKSSGTTDSNVTPTTLNPSGTGDFDLRDSNTWQTLMGKASSSSGPKVGIEKRTSAEERKKQLDRSRDEARAQRERDFKSTFDLQAQGQKMALFEKRLSHHETKMHGPSVVGAAFLIRPLLSHSQESS